MVLPGKAQIISRFVQGWLDTSRQSENSGVQGLTRYRSIGRRQNDRSPFSQTSLPSQAWGMGSMEWRR